MLSMTPETRTLLVNADACETIDEGGRVLVAVERDRLVVSEGVVPVLAPVVGGLRPGTIVADQLLTSRTPARSFRYWWLRFQ